MKKIELKFDEDNGQVYMDDNSVILISRGQIAWIQRECEKAIGPAASFIIYESGRIYAQHTNSNILGGVIKLMGKASKKTIAVEMVKQFPLWGYGCAEVVEFDYSKKFARMKLTNSPNVMGYENSKKPVCHFIRGVVAGAASIIAEEDMYCIETKCVAMGDPHCMFEVMTCAEAESRRIERVYYDK